MSEELHLPKNGDKEEIYASLIPQIEALIFGEPDLIANLSNIAAALKEAFNHLWIGFYLVKGDQLVLGPFQGPIACTRISMGKGVCGSSWEQKSTLLVEDVELFPGHIACSSLSRSEIVVPVLVSDQVVMVLDIDSVEVGSFDQTDQIYLEKLATIISQSITT